MPRSRTGSTAIGEQVPIEKVKVDNRELRQGKRKSGVKRTTKRRAKVKEYCVCRGVDDGTPMVQCAECKNW
jgi:chloramphenicol 3-O-phosphotransferase